MLIPSLQNLFHIERYPGTNLIQFSRRKTIVATQRQRCEPVFADPVLTLNVYMLWLIAVEAVKENPVRPGNVLDGRHSSSSWLYRIHRIANTMSSRNFDETCFL